MSRRDITFDDALPERRAVQRCANQTQGRFTGGIGCLGKGAVRRASAAMAHFADHRNSAIFFLSSLRLRNLRAPGSQLSRYTTRMRPLPVTLGNRSP